MKLPFQVIVADTSELLEQCFRLRYEIFHVEKKLDLGVDGTEFDDSDEHAHHILLLDKQNPVGTVRMIIPSENWHGFQIIKYCSPSLLDHLPIKTTGEISRFSLSKKISTKRSLAMRLALMQGVLQLSVKLGLTHWCAIMEPSLLRLLETNSIHFIPLGPLVEAKGLRQPAWLCIKDALERGYNEQREAWDYVTMNGYLNIR